MAEQAPAPKTVKIDLRNDVTISNAVANHSFKKGDDVEIPAELVDEVKRIDREHEAYKASLMVKRTSTVDAGSFSVGGGE